MQLVFRVRINVVRVLQVMFPLSLHVSAYMAIFKCIEQTNNKEKASRQTHTQGNSKNNEGKKQ
jgi:hypothetical protein